MCYYQFDITRNTIPINYTYMETVWAATAQKNSCMVNVMNEIELLEFPRLLEETHILK